MLLSVIPSYSQNFMMYMDVELTTLDTTITWCHEKVVWGMKDNEICLMWGIDRMMCFTQKGHGKRAPRAVYKAMDKHIEAFSKMKDADELQVRDIFYNRYGEIFLIAIYMGKGTFIVINRLDEIYPYYTFEMTLKTNNYE